MTFYYQGFVFTEMQDNEKAAAAFMKAEKANPDYCFPNKAEEIVILQRAVKVLGTAPYAHYYLGLFIL